MRQHQLPRLWLLEEVQGQEEVLNGLWSPPKERQAERLHWKVPAWFRWALISCWTLILTLNLMTPAEVEDMENSTYQEVFSAPEGFTVLAWHLHYANSGGSLSDWLVQGTPVLPEKPAVMDPSPRSALEEPRKQVRLITLQSLQAA